MARIDRAAAVLGLGIVGTLLAGCGSDGKAGSAPVSDSGPSGTGGTDAGGGSGGAGGGSSGGGGAAGGRALDGGTDGATEPVAPVDGGGGTDGAGPGVDGGGGGVGGADAGDAGSGIAPPPCAPNERKCSGVCVNVGRDAQNCGACGAACGSDQTCSGGACVSSCSAALQFTLLGGEALPGSTSSLSFGDANDDKRPDVVAATPLGLVLASGGQTSTLFAGSTTVSTDATLSGGIVRLDPDLIPDVFQETADAYVGFKGDGVGNFSSMWTYTVGAHSGRTIIADVNGTGTPVLVTASYSTGSLSAFAQVLGVGGPAQDPIPLYYTGPFDSPADTGIADLAVGYFDGDAYADVVVARNSGANSAIVLMPEDGTSFGTPVVRSLTGGARSVVVADFDGDGKDDIATATGTSLHVFLMGASGLAATPVDTVIDAGAVALSADAADFDGDGKADLVVAATVGSDTSVYFARGAGDGAFTLDAGSYTLPGVGALRARDMNADGKVDVVVATESPALLRVMRNDCQ